jgi:hypothetical protein
LESSKVQFILKGFSEIRGFRIFAFERIASDRTRDLFSVKADLTLIRRYGIRLQELPLLCRSVLERCDDSGEKRAFAFSEQDMRLHADGLAARAEAAKHKRPPRKPAIENLGAAWRVPSP